MKTADKPKAAIGSVRWWLLSLWGIVCGGVIGLALLFIIGKVWLWLVYGISPIA